MGGMPMGGMPMGGMAGGMGGMPMNMGQMGGMPGKIFSCLNSSLAFENTLEHFQGTRADKK